MTQPNRVVGIDIAKHKADACIRALGLRLSLAATQAGEREMIAWLRQHQVTLAVMEASGGYEQGWAKALRAAGIAVRIVDPKRVRYFAKSAGRHAKNDAIDAEMIAWFGEIFGAAGEESYDADRETLDRLVTARALLVKLQAAVRQLDEHEQPQVVLAAQRALLKVFATQIGKLEAAAEAKIAASPPLAARAKIIASVPGLGRHFTAGALAWLPELGHIGNKPLAALVGLAPYDDDSGEHAGERHIKGGRREVRNLLYMATLGAATQHNPVLVPYYRKLRARGKKAKVALVACMRKIITILNTMLARNQTWNPPAAPAGDTPIAAAAPA